MATKKRQAAPPQQLADLARSVKKGLARLVVLRGEERWFIEEALKLITAKAQDGGLELSRHDANDPEFNGALLMDDLVASPLFATERLVVARNVEDLLKKSGKDHSALTRAVTAAVQDESRGGCVVVTCRKLRADHALCKLAKELGAPVLELRKLWDSPPPWRAGDPTEAETVQWLLARARERKLRLDPRDAVYICAAVGNDLFALDTALEKLRHGGGKAVRELVGWDSSAAPWGAADKLLDGQLGPALAAVEALYRGGMDDERTGRRNVDPRALSAILGATLRNRLRELARGARAIKGGGNASDAVRAAGVKGAPTTVQAFSSRVEKRSAADWEGMLADFLDMEAKSRAGGGAVLDADALFRFALRWRIEAPSFVRGGGRRG
jgi:DNA polymerase III delta subunit